MKPIRRAAATSDELQRARQLRTEGFSQTNIGQQMGVSRGTISGWLSKTPPENLATPDILELEVLRKQVQELRKAINSQQDRALTTEVVRRQIFKLGDLNPLPPAWVPRPTSVGSLGTPLAILSDVHWGEVTNPEALNGFNAYNVAIAKARLRLWAEKILSLSFDLNRAPNYPGLVLCLGGDIFSGDIHEELAETNETSLMVAMLEVLEELITVIRALVKQFKRVFLPCTFGNHGRNTTRPRFKMRAYSNFDWLLCTLLEKFLKGEPGIEFLISGSTDTFFTVQNRRFMLNHGDTLGARGGDGFIGPLGPMKRGEGKARRSAESMKLPFDHLVHGHFHTQMMLGRSLANGAMCGYNEYAKDFLRAEPEEASQLLAFIHEKHGVIDYKPLYLGSEQGESGKLNVNSSLGGNFDLQHDRKPSKKES